MSATKHPITRPEIHPCPEKITRTLLACILSAAIFLDYWSYSRQFYSESRVYRDVLEGTAAAPNQYRVGAIRAANFIASQGHIGLRHGMTLLDALSAATAVFLLYALLRNSTPYRSAANAMQWAASAAFLVLVQFYLAWLLWYQRPETLPTTALVALTLWLLTPSRQNSKKFPRWATFTGLLLVASAQGLVRADVIFCFDLGILLVASSRFGKGFSISRNLLASAAFLGALIAGGIQFYMMRVAYPHVGYGSTPVFQLLLNATDHLRAVPFLLFMVPWAWTLNYFARHQDALPAPSAALLAGSILFLPLWCVVGKIDEVRIFLPFALALAPLTVEAVMRRASTEP